MTDPLLALSDSIAARVEAIAPALLTVSPGGRAQRSAFLWQDGVAVTAEQDLPREAELTVQLAGGERRSVRVGGRDPGTNVALLHLDPSAPAPRLAPCPPRAGALALALGAADGLPTFRLGAIARVGPAWDSMAGGRIDHDIRLDLRLSRRDEGGPVLAADGGLLGMATIGPRGRAIVIPAETLARAVPLLLRAGRSGGAWLGIGLQPVSLPPALQASAGREAGLMVVGLAAGGPAEQAGLLPGDILLEMGGEATRHPRAVARALAFVPVGQAVPLRLLRAGLPLDLQATVAQRPAA